MPSWSKRASPVDRSVRELERQIAAVQRQMRQVSPAAPTAASPPAPTTGAKVRQLAQDWLRPAAPPPRAMPRVFDSAEQSLSDLGAEPIAFAVQHEPDLFTPATAAPNVPEKLAHYLGAGSIRSFRPARRQARATRNRFFMWVGLSLLVLWLIYYVVR